MKITRVGVAAVIKHEGKVLLGFRKGKHSPNVWACPGGHVEFGEHPRETAVRETKEETNLDIKPSENWDLGWTSNVYEEEGKHYITLFIRCDIENPEELRLCEPEKCAEWKWYNMDEIPNNLMNNTTLDMLKKA